MLATPFVAGCDDEAALAGLGGLLVAALAEPLAELGFDWSADLAESFESFESLFADAPPLFKLTRLEAALEAA